MNVLEIIAEWRKGCSCTHNYADRTRDFPPSYCPICTTAALDAIEKVEQERVLRDLIQQFRRNFGGSPAGANTLHAGWDVVWDAEALLAGKETLYREATMQWCIEKLRGVAPAQGHAGKA